MPPRRGARGRRSRGGSATRGRPRPATRRSSDDVQIVGQVLGSPIDLTCDVDDDVIVDLTSPRTVNQNLQPIMILGSEPNTPARPSRRRRQLRVRLGQDQGDQDLDDDDDSDELPDIPFKMNTAPSTLAANPADQPGPSGDAMMSPPGGIKCPICLENDKNIKKSGGSIMSTTCGHVFCQDCIISAINAQHKCPTCRKKLTVKQVHKLFI